MAFGFEWREDEGRFKADDLLFTGDALGFNPQTTVQGKESVREVYAEALIPLAEDTFIGQYLGLEIGGRYSDYKNAGKVDSLKIGGDWQLNSTLRFRAMAQRSVRAPDLVEAFAERRESDGSFVPFQPIDDPCSASADPIGNGFTDACIASGLPASEVGAFEALIQFPTLFIDGGNPGLTPETAETVTVGAVITPQAWPNWQFSVDYYDLEVEDEIGSLDVSLACFDPTNSENLFCDRITRDPAGGYNVSEVDERTINRGVLATRGVDTQIQGSFALPDSFGLGSNSADLVVSSTWTRMLNNSYQQTNFGTVFECSGQFGWPCNGQKSGTTWPRDRLTTTFNYASGDFNAHLTWQWIANVDNAGFMGSAILFPTFPEPIMATPDTGVRNYLDLGLGYQFTDRITGRLTISNLLDEDPPQMADATNNNTDTALYDVFGRSYTLRFSFRL